MTQLSAPLLDNQNCHAYSKRILFIFSVPLKNAKQIVLPFVAYTAIGVQTCHSPFFYITAGGVYQFEGVTEVATVILMSCCTSSQL